MPIWLWLPLVLVVSGLIVFLLALLVHGLSDKMASRETFVIRHTMEQEMAREMEEGE